MGYQLTVFSVTQEGIDGIIPSIPFDAVVIEYQEAIPREITAIKILTHVLNHHFYAIMRDCVLGRKRLVMTHIPFTPIDSKGYVTASGTHIAIAVTLATLDTLVIQVSIMSFREYYYSVVGLNNP